MDDGDRAAGSTKSLRWRTVTGALAAMAILDGRRVDWPQPGTAGSDADTTPQRSATTVARRRLGAAVLASIVITIAAIATASQLRSPAQKAAETAPPPRSVLTAAVEKRVLTATVVVRGQVGAEQTVDVGGRDGTETARIVTAVKVKYGDRVNPGQVLMELSGRPVLALPGGVPSYRDLRPGATGSDVAQLQAALASLGFVSDDRAGTYGTGTKHAVLGFYRSKGYEPLPASEEDDTLLSRAQQAVTVAERRLRDARIALERAQGAGEARIAAARLAVADRTQDLTQATNERDTVERRTGPIVPAAEVVFLRGFPGRVDAVVASVGARAKEKSLTVSAGRLVIRGELTSYQRGLVRKGLPVRVLADTSGTTADATVQSVADTPRQPEAATDGAENRHAQTVGVTYELLAVPRGTFDPRLAGQDVRLAVVAASSKEPVLVVPVAAVSGGPDGRTSVTVVTDAERRRVDVTAGLVGDGYVQVTPLHGHDLTATDQVLVGT
ncbi:peptidoglycan-binding domain-containing protein [Micromonospora sp. NPDC049679]|uniref:peptidoglycan-binding domain-containing protein n=1 Tax=Micromonospora sp. NPDC049679 TaxID=3155920 RepID=UPI0033DAE1A3